MADIKEVLKNLAIQIRDEHKVGANTAKRVGDLLCAFVDALGPDLEELAKYFLRKDKEDGTNHLLKFGEFIDSMVNGKGAGIYPDGRGQFENLEVRGALTMIKMLINEIQLMNSDHMFTDVGLVNNVEDLGESTYRLTIEKRTEADITSLKEGHIIKQVVNNILLGGTTHYTSWMRVLNTNTNTNTITVVLYQANQCPGGVNNPPCKDYAVARQGTVNIPDDGDFNPDSAWWTLSSREQAIRFYQNVFKPILEDYNYEISIGKFPDIKAISHLPIPKNAKGVMAQIGIFNKLYEYDYNGYIVTKKVPRDEWSLAVAQSDAPYRYITSDEVSENGTKYNELEQHVVEHLGFEWACLIDKTVEEPKWNSQAWRALNVRKSDYTIQPVSSTDSFRFMDGEVNTIVTALIFFGDNDITEQLLAIQCKIFIKVQTHIFLTKFFL